MWTIIAVFVPSVVIADVWAYVCFADVLRRCVRAMWSFVLGMKLWVGKKLSNVLPKNTAQARYTKLSTLVTTVIILGCLFRFSFSNVNAACRRKSVFSFIHKFSPMLCGMFRSAELSELDIVVVESCHLDRCYFCIFFVLYGVQN